MLTNLLEMTPQGLYCPAGRFHIDPWQAVDRAVITHAHSDHARWGSRRYLAVADGARLLRARLGEAIDLQTVRYGEILDCDGVRVSLHPAGHVLGSAQVRIERDGEVCVVSGDYKLDPDPTCTPFEPVRCHTFLTESTFGMPIYRWDHPDKVFEEINDWWRSNRDEGKASVLYAYALGKAQRLLAGVDPGIGPIYTHGAVEKITREYRESGVELPPTIPIGPTRRGHSWAGALIVAPPSADGSPWARKFEPASSALASGWMRVRGQRRRRAFDRGFVLSDHADWPGLDRAVRATRAENIVVMHGSSAIFARWLNEKGWRAEVLATRFQGEADLAEGREEPA